MEGFFFMCAFTMVSSRLQQLSTFSVLLALLALPLYLYNATQGSPVGVTSHVLHRCLQMVNKRLLKEGKLNKTYKK